MDHSFRAGLILIAGVALLATALALHAILLETVAWTVGLGALGAILALRGAYALRAELGALLRRRRAEVALYTAGVIAVLLVLAHLSVRYPFRFDLTEARRYSLSEPT